MDVDRLSSFIDRVWYRSYMNPTSKNKAPVLKPWLIMYRTEPCRPAEFRDTSPSTQNPRWATDEYATSFMTSVCVQQMSPAYTMPTIATIAMARAYSISASGAIGSAKR